MQKCRALALFAFCILQIDMTTFDQISPILADILRSHSASLTRLVPMIVNRDLNGRVRLIVGEKIREDTEARQELEAITRQMAERLGPHAFPPEHAVLYESNVESARGGLPSCSIKGLENICLVDRLATESNWASISPVTTGVPRIVFFSIKSGVGRSTALAASAWALAQQGKRVLVLDLDLESPGLSSSLLPDDRRPSYGIADWLVQRPS